jgi:hypothetical protein
MQVGRTVLIAVELLSASIWLGSLVCLALVARVARQVLDGPSRIALFRGIGRVYGPVGTSALLIAIAAGIVLAGPPSHWSPMIATSFALSFLLVVITVAGMLQARAMTRRRQRALDAPGDLATNAIRRGAAQAGALRATMSLLTLVILVLGARLLDG